MKNRRDFLKFSGALGFMAAFGGEILAQNANLVSEINRQGAKMQTVTLNNGVKIPIFGLGTYKLTGKTCENIVSNALDLGYRLIDTAQMYQNETEVAKGVLNAQKNGIKREEIFIETKISPTNYSNAKREIDERLRLLGVEYFGFAFDSLEW